MGTQAEHANIIETINFLIERYPKAFSLDRSGIRPLKDGILDDLVADLGSEAFRPPMRRALAYYKTRLHYLRKVISGKNYRDLRGNRCGLVTPEAKERAAKVRDEIIAKRRADRVQAEMAEVWQHCHEDG